MNLSSTLYNELLTISSQFEFEDESDEISEKEEILKESVLKGYLKKRTDDRIKYWYRYYCAVSGGYLYFYKTEQSIRLQSYYYLKEATVQTTINE